LRIGNGPHVDLLRYLAWLLLERHVRNEKQDESAREPSNTSEVAEGAAAIATRRPAPRGHGQKFTAKQEAMIAALLTESTHLAAAKKAGIHPATFYRWMHVPEFREAYREARRELVEAAIGRVQAGAGEAVETLLEVARGGKRDGDRVRAALALLNHALDGLTNADVLHGPPLQAENESMATGDVVELLGARLQQIDRSALTTAEKARLTATLTDAFIRAFGEPMRSLRAIANKYDVLTPEERLGLIIAAGARGDDSEQDRLIRAAQMTYIPANDYVPYAHSLREVSMMAFVDLLEEAARYQEAILRIGSIIELDDEDEDEEEEEDEEELFDGQDLDDDLTFEDRLFAYVLAAGYAFKAKADGWKLFCERLCIPPFVLMECLPGFERLQRAFKWSEELAYTQRGFLKWMNLHRPDGESQLTESPLTAQGMADAAELSFRTHAKKYGCVGE
ncbi:Phage protein, partial [Durusdinium trenchii]